MIEMLTKILAKITIIVVENREPSFITICKCKQGPLSLFSYQMLTSILTIDERSSYYKGLWIIIIIQALCFSD